MDKLREFPSIVDRVNPDLIVQMGDVIRDTFDKDNDKELYRQVVGVFSNLDIPYIHLLGNHDVLALSRNELSDIYKNLGLIFKPLGVIEQNNFQIVWLDLVMDENKNSYISNEGISLLNEIDKNKQTIIFSHYSMTMCNEKDNFYSSANQGWMSYSNIEEVDFLENFNVVAFINAHAHWGSAKYKEKVPYITVPSFTENIAGMDYPDNNPGIYTVLEIIGDKMILKSYSGEFAFMNFEFEI